MGDVMQTPKAIRPISIGVFRRGGDILVFEELDRVKGSSFCRPLGGGIEPGERAVEALHREIREELGAEIVRPRLISVVENLFECQGLPGHEIVFVFEAELADRSLYERDALVGSEGGTPFPVVWRSLSSFNERYRLVPTELIGLLGAAGASLHI
jgi:ADP-ribose pyrophosphatase YjhB (NUDIX family)